MCNYSDFVENRGRKEGIKEGEAKALVNLMQKLKMTIEQALDTLSIPEAEWDDYRMRVAQLEAHLAQ
ncbi:MAG: hypothetical protein IKY83_09855 [Proteobacteria bacterium]|nr:hypothetical protein [Pseudomonadota bacterium]